jgi:hypothetical protein
MDVQVPTGCHAKAGSLDRALIWEAKDWHGLRRFRLRGLEKVNSEGLRIAAGQNLKRYLAAKGWGRRQAPGGSLVASRFPVAMFPIRSNQPACARHFSTRWSVLVLRRPVRSTTDGPSNTVAENPFH